MKMPLYQSLKIFGLAGLLALNLSCSSSEITRIKPFYLENLRFNKPGESYTQKTIDYHVGRVRLKSVNDVAKVEVEVLEKSYFLSLRENLYCDIFAFAQGHKIVGFDFPVREKFKYHPLIINQELISSTSPPKGMGVSVTSTSYSVDILDMYLNENYIKNYIFNTDESGKIVFYLRYHNTDFVISDVLTYNEFQSRKISSNGGVFQITLDDTTSNLEPVNDYYLSPRPIYISQVSIGEVILEKPDGEFPTSKYLRENKTLFVLFEKSPLLVKKEGEEARRKIIVEREIAEAENKKRERLEYIRTKAKQVVNSNLKSLDVVIITSQGLAPRTKPIFQMISYVPTALELLDDYFSGSELEKAVNFAGDYIGKKGKNQLYNIDLYDFNKASIVVFVPGDYYFKAMASGYLQEDDTHEIEKGGNVTIRLRRDPTIYKDASSDKGGIEIK